MDYAFTDRWSLKSGVMFTSKGYKHGEFKARPIYLEFPVMGAIKMPITERVKFVVNAGVYFAAGLVGQYDTSDVTNLADGLSSSGAYKTLIFDDVTGIFRRFDVGVQYGVGVELADHYLIHLVVSGHGQYTMNGRSFTLGPGDLFLVKPNQLVSYCADANDPWEYYWVGFNGAFANKLVQQTPFTDQSPVYHCGESESLKQALRSIYDCRGPESHHEAAMVGHLYLFLSCLMKQAHECDPRVSNTSSQYVHGAIKYIQFNYSHDISIDDIAKAVGVSRSHLYRVFMSNVGQSPIDYLTNYRIGEACNLLRDSKLSIAEIAVSVGFFDQFYFSRVFKKTKGVPPSRYLSSIEKP